MTLAEKMSEILKDVPANPPRRSGSLPGLRWKNAFDQRSLFLPLIFVAFFLLFPLMILTTIPSSRLKGKPKVHVQGIVTAVREAGTDEQPCKEFSYSFETKERQRYLGKQTLRRDSPYFRATNGDPVPIIYAENEPALNGIDSVTDQEMPPLAFFAILPVFVLLFFSPLLLPNLRSVAEARKVFKNGIISEAEVVFVKKRSGFGGFHFPISKGEVYFAYRTARGEQIESKTVCDNDWLVNKLDVGSPIHVAYLEDKPQKSVILEAFIR